MANGHCDLGLITDANWMQDDRSLTRSHPYMLQLFEKSRLQLLSYAQQKNFPRELFKVHMYALRPRS